MGEGLWVAGDAHLCIGPLQGPGNAAQVTHPVVDNNDLTAQRDACLLNDEALVMEAGREAWTDTSVLVAGDLFQRQVPVLIAGQHEKEVAHPVEVAQDFGVGQAPHFIKGDYTAFGCAGHATGHVHGR